MGLALAGILKTAASSLLGDKLKDIAVEKATSIAREKLDLPAAASVADIDIALSENPEAYAQITEAVTAWRIEQERTHQVAMQEQGASERVALQSESRFVKYARPAALYGAVLSCILLIISGLVVTVISAVTGEPELFNYYVGFVEAAKWPITALMTNGGIYTYRRSTDKAINKGLSLPPILNFGGK